jgi:hypothetical protein
MKRQTLVVVKSEGKSPVCICWGCRFGDGPLDSAILSLTDLRGPLDLFFGVTLTLWGGAEAARSNLRGVETGGALGTVLCFPFEEVEVLGWLAWVLGWFFFFVDVPFWFWRSFASNRFVKFNISSECLLACRSRACCIAWLTSTVLLWTWPVGFCALLVWAGGAQGFWEACILQFSGCRGKVGGSESKLCIFGMIAGRRSGGQFVGKEFKVSYSLSSAWADKACKSQVLEWHMNIYVCMNVLEPSTSLWFICRMQLRNSRIHRAIVAHSCCDSWSVAATGCRTQPQRQGVARSRSDNGLPAVWGTLWPLSYMQYDLALQLPITPFPPNKLRYPKKIYGKNKIGYVTLLYNQI